MIIRRKLDKYIYVFCFLGPAVVYIIFWRILPFLYTLYLSLTSWNLIYDIYPTYVGFENFIKILYDTKFWKSLWITVMFTSVVIIIELVIGMALAVLLNEKIKGKKFFRVSILIPMVLTPVVVGTIWYILFHDSLGPINYALSFFGFKGVSWLGLSKTALISIMISDIWQWTPFMFLFIYSALQVIPEELYEAAKVDGAKGFQLFQYITLPIIKDIVYMSLIFRSMDAFRVFDKVFVMTGGGPGDSTEVLSILVYKSAFRYFNIGYSATLVVMIFLFGSIIYSFYFKYFKLED